MALLYMMEHLLFVSRHLTVLGGILLRFGFMAEGTESVLTSSTARYGQLCQRFSSSPLPYVLAMNFLSSLLSCSWNLKRINIWELNGLDGVDGDAG